MSVVAAVAAPERTLIIACGALAREILDVVEVNRWHHLDLICLPASLHNHPDKIPDAVQQAIAAARTTHGRIFVGYADCGTGGALDRLLEAEEVKRLPGAHCYAFYSGVGPFERRAEADMRAFFLTDFLVRQFDVLVIEGLGLDRYPELRDTYFRHYEKVVFLAQTQDAALRRAAEVAAERLGLAFEYRFTGYGDLATAMTTAGEQG